MSIEQRQADLDLEWKAFYAEFGRAVKGYVGRKREEKRGELQARQDALNLEREARASQQQPEQAVVHGMSYKTMLRNRKREEERQRWKFAVNDD